MTKDTETITALMVMPNTPPCIIELYKDMNFLETAVCLGAHPPFFVSTIRLSKDAAILFDEEAPLCSCKGNRKIGNEIIAGVFYVIGVENGNLVSLSAKNIKKYKERFWEPETYSDEEVAQAYFDNYFYELIEEPQF